MESNKKMNLTADGVDEAVRKRLGQKEYQAAKFSVEARGDKYYGVVNGLRLGTKSFVTKEAARNYAIDFAHKQFVVEGKTSLAAKPKATKGLGRGDGGDNAKALQLIQQAISGLRTALTQVKSVTQAIDRSGLSTYQVTKAMSIEDNIKELIDDLQLELRS